MIVRLGTVPLLGHTDITLEATAYGAILGLRAIALILCGLLYTLAVDPDEVLRLFRRVSFRSALSATLATRMVPILVRDGRRLAEAQRCRPGPPPSRLTLMRAACTGVLDRALDVAAALEVRGYGAARRPPAYRRGPGSYSRHDVAFVPPRSWWSACRSSARVELRRGVLGLSDPPRGRRVRARSSWPPGWWWRRWPPLPTAGGWRDDRGLAGAGHLHVSRRRRARVARCVASDRARRARAGRGWLGSGKSSLLRAISGLVPHFHGGTFAGRATVAGLDTRDHGPGELAQAVGTLFQDPETQVVTGTVRAELAFGLENRGLSPAEVARGVEEAALALAIDQLLDRSTAELSGGELQRVALGAALAGRPRVVVLDEPTSQLDPVAGDELIGLLRRVNEDSDATIVLAEHRLERCLGAADRVVALAERADRVRRRPGRVPRVGRPRGAQPPDAGGATPGLRSAGRRCPASNVLGPSCAVPVCCRARPVRRATGGHRSPASGGGRAAARRVRRPNRRWPLTMSLLA